MRIIAAASSQVGAPAKRVGREHGARGALYGSVCEADDWNLGQTADSCNDHMQQQSKGAGQCLPQLCICSLWNTQPEVS